MHIARSFRNLITTGVAVLIMGGCGGSKKPTAPLSNFQPEIVSIQDNFQFQATNLDNVSATVQYMWANSGNRASIDHSSAVTAGTTSVTLFDANGAQVYTSGLLASGTQQADSGAAGDWLVRVILTNCSGTLNFRAQKL
ncbi:MAG: hypothetical protein AB1644_01475 [Candidatus Zixiibacteriota bacterium]